jgi:hypothetical protein
MIQKGTAVPPLLLVERWPQRKAGSFAPYLAQERAFSYEDRTKTTRTPEYSLRQPYVYILFHSGHISAVSVSAEPVKDLLF